MHLGWNGRNNISLSWPGSLRNWLLIYWKEDKFFEIWSKRPFLSLTLLCLYNLKLWNRTFTQLTLHCFSPSILFFLKNKNLSVPSESMQCKTKLSVVLPSSSKRSVWNEGLSIQGMNGSRLSPRVHNVTEITAVICQWSSCFKFRSSSNKWVWPCQVLLCQCHSKLYMIPIRSKNTFRIWSWALAKAEFFFSFQ